MEIHRRLDDELDVLRDRVLVLGGEAEGALRRSMRALAERDGDAARAVLENDAAIDRLEVEIDRLCIDVLALRQPAARDLRFVVAVAKATPILERVADHACNIARAALDLIEEPEMRSAPELAQMAEAASEMLSSALDAFTRGDAPAARRIIALDARINELYTRAFRGLIETMSHDPTTTGRAARLLLVAKHLERVGDYVTDICELTVYMTEAEVIKHSH
jgi:phosphate transport system protein